MNKYSTIQPGEHCYVCKAGEIRVKATSRGMSLQCFNYTQNRYVSTGSISGAVYEKGNISLLKVVNGKYQPSISLTVAELQTALDLGATFLRCISPDKSTTYSIALSAFDPENGKAEIYTNSYYGEQLAVSVDDFGKTGKSKKRNKVLDNPPTEVGEGYQRPQAEQLPLIPLRYGLSGNYRGGGA